MKKIFVFILSVFLTLGVIVDSESTINAFENVFSTVVKKEKDELIVKVSINEMNTKIDSLDLTISYDKDKVELVKQKDEDDVFSDGLKGNVVPNSALTSFTNHPNEGEVKLSLASLTPLTKEGELAIFKFKIKDKNIGGLINFDLSIDSCSVDSIAVNASDLDKINNMNIGGSIFIEIPLENISLSNETATLNVGDSKILTVNYVPENTTISKDVKWTSSNEAVAKVSNGGLVNAINRGEAIITATVGNHKANCIITVNKPLIEIKFDRTNIQMLKGKETKLNILYTPDDSTDISEAKWESSDKSIVEVNENGVLKAKKEGKAKIQVTINSLVAVCDVEVIEKPIETIILDTMNLNLKVGTSKKINVSYLPVDTTDEIVESWKSADETIAKVDGNGKIKGIKEGSTTISVTIAGKTASCVVTVYEIPLVNIALNYENLELVKKQEVQLTVTYSPSDTTDSKLIEWTSSNERVAKVDKAGNVKALSAGTSIITAKVGGISASCTISVKEVPLESFVLNKESISLYEGETSEIDIILNPENTTDDIEILWLSSDDKVAEVDELGKIKALKEGNTVITAKIGDLEQQCVVTVLRKDGKVESESNSKETNKISTGDNSNTSLLFSILGISMIIIIANIKRKKKI